MRVTHPFHPFAGRQLFQVGERYNRYGTRVLLKADGHICSVPREWTDLVAPDPEVAIAAGRSLFRLRDLMDLARIVADLAATHSLEAPDEM